MKTNITQSIEIYRDGKLDYWASNKHKIVPGIVKFLEDGQDAFKNATENVYKAAEAVNSQLDKVATRSW